MTPALMGLHTLKGFRSYLPNIQKSKRCELLRKLPGRKGLGFRREGAPKPREDRMEGESSAPGRCPSLPEAFSDSTDGSDFSCLGSPELQTRLCLSTGLG